MKKKYDTVGQNRLKLYRWTLLNAYNEKNSLDERPDFLIDLGDTFHTEYYAGRDAFDLEEAFQRHLDQRPFLGLVCHSMPLFLALGNHEGEEGWRLDISENLDSCESWDYSENNIAVWATKARKALYPNPLPNGFFSGSTDDCPFVGRRENYYSWVWGNALFIVLDPYWYTKG